MLLRLLIVPLLVIACKDKGGDDSGSGVDADGDGYTAADDCDDADPAINPDAEEIDDDIDNDCDGAADEYLNLVDGDGDGWSAAGGDCDDADATRSPGADEDTGDGIDNDCDDVVDETPEQEDDDGDGYSEEEGDCDDADDGVSPGTDEIEDGVDNDCDEQTDEGTTTYDDDGDGFAEVDGDCDDADGTTYPGAPDTPYDGEDQDCGWDNDFDADKDGYASDDYGGMDCDDTNGAVSPDDLEVCDGVDNDCDDESDEGLLGLDESCPATSCLLTLTSSPESEDGLYWIDPLGTGATEVWCDMTNGGWTLVARATNAGGVVENGTLADGAETGTLPITPDSEGNAKLSDDLVNALRLGSMPNDLKVVVALDGVTLGESWHPQDCVLQTGVEVDAEDPCNASTTGGADDLDYLQSTTDATLGRWGEDEELGYLWGAPGVRLGPVEGGTEEDGVTPSPWCGWTDEATVCPVESSVELWAL